MTNDAEPLIDLDSLPTDIDHLMSLNPLNLTPPAREAYLDGVIAYHRNIRAAKEAGMKVPRAKAGAKAPVKISLEDLGLSKKAPVATVQRRV